MILSKMNLVRSFAASLVVSSVLSCGSSTESPIIFTLGSSKTFLVPAKTQSCKEFVELAGSDALSIGSRYFQFDNPTIGWRETDPAVTVNIIGINLKIRSSKISGGAYDCLITGEDLKYLYYRRIISSGQTINLFELWDPTQITSTTGSAYYTGDEVLSSTGAHVSGGFESCPIRCGGVSSTPNETFTVPVTLEIIALASKLNGDGTITETPYKTATTGTVQQLF